MRSCGQEWLSEDYKATEKAAKKGFLGGFWFGIFIFIRIANNVRNLNQTPFKVLIK